MQVGETYMLRNFDRDPCPVCGERFSRCGLPNHIRGHNLSGMERLKRKAAGRKSAAWWDGWKEGYKGGLEDGMEGSKTKPLLGVILSGAFALFANA